VIVGSERRGDVSIFREQHRCSTLWVFRIKTGRIPHNLGKYLCGFYRLQMRNPKVSRYLLRVFTTDPDYRRFVVQEVSARIVSAFFPSFFSLFVSEIYTQFMLSFSSYNCSCEEYNTTRGGVEQKNHLNILYRWNTNIFRKLLIHLSLKSHWRTKHNIIFSCYDHMIDVLWFWLISLTTRSALLYYLYFVWLPISVLLYKAFLFRWCTLGHGL